jgi:hypothetical protein
MSEQLLSLADELDGERSRSAVVSEELVQDLATSITDKWQMSRLIPRRLQVAIIARAIVALFENVVPDRFKPLASIALTAFRDYLQGKSLPLPSAN